jgi:hypothetical protein
MFLGHLLKSLFPGMPLLNEGLASGVFAFQSSLDYPLAENECWGQYLLLFACSCYFVSQILLGVVSI